MEQKPRIKSKKTILFVICLAGFFAGIWLISSSMKEFFLAQSEADQAHVETERAQVEYDAALKDCLEVAYTECKNATMKVCMQDGTSFKACEEEWWQDFDRVRGA